MLSKLAKPLILTAITLSLSSCVVGPDYQRPNTKLMSSFVGSPTSNAEDLRVRWWESFKDPQLIKLVELAVQNNSDIESAISRVNEARALTWETRLDLLPAITSNAGYTSNKSSEVVVPFIEDSNLRKLKYYNAGFDASWEVDLFGRSQRALESSLAQQAALVATLDDALVTVISETATTYFELLATRRQLRLAQREKALLKQSFELQKLRYESGQIDRRSMIVSRNSLLEKAAEIPALRAQIAQSINALSVLCGKTPGRLPLALKQNPQLKAFRGPVTIGSPEKLLERRPDLRKAEQDLINYSANRGYNYGDLLPKLNFAGNIQFFADRSVDIGRTDPGYLINPYISWVGFDIGHVLARVNAADAAYEAVLADYQGSVKKAVADVQDRLALFSSERARYRTFSELTTNWKEITKIDRLRYKVGSIGKIEQIDGRLTRISKAREKLSSKLALNSSIIALYKALGGGWEAVRISPEDSPVLNSESESRS